MILFRLWVVCFFPTFGPDVASVCSLERLHVRRARICGMYFKFQSFIFQLLYSMMTRQLGLFAVLIGISAGFAQAQVRKIGVVSLQDIIFSMPEAKKAETTLQAFQKELEQTYVEMVREYQQKDSIFRADSATWTQTKRDLKRGDLGRLVQQLQTYQQGVEQQIQRKQQELVAPIRAKALEAVQKVASKNGYTYVLEASVVYHFGPEDDISGLVKRELSKASVDKAKPGVKPAAHSGVKMDDKPKQTPSSKVQ